jgi:hypothetical protein
MMWLWIFGSTVEVVVVEVVLRHIDQPWAAAVRVPLLVLGIWGVAWMLGMLASLRVRPHLLTDTELRARSGARTWLVVPLAAVESTRSVSTSCLVLSDRFTSMTTWRWWVQAAAPTSSWYWPDPQPCRPHRAK